ncbi:uncharacterized protein N7515_003268 [Penicillium bovifimosum]|uniref:Lipocalin-like domain-containing protein n=1 Tax=Penicillium bovifimosum TaxID=126998 RepID=A0A9W9L624_9EURO|nr:uncharacterized protein N7515_003268 [Penicillium bovifimosum]KAJ5138420.1 hypothetical protein N7515_003268 [Penicillium bovifimosum]
MAAPTDITMKNLNGTWELDSTKSNPTDPILALQGMGWIMRKTLSLATVTIHIHQYQDKENPSVTAIDAQQVITGGIKASPEERRLDWELREREDAVFGRLSSRSRFIGGKAEGDAIRPVLDVQTSTGNPEEDAKVQKFLVGEILADGSKSDGFVGEEGEEAFLHSFVQSLENGWTAEQVWGFEIVEGERLHARRIAVAKDGKVEYARLVYSFKERRAEA